MSDQLSPVQAQSELDKAWDEAECTQNKATKLLKATFAEFICRFKDLEDAQTASNRKIEELKAALSKKTEDLEALSKKIEDLEAALSKKTEDLEAALSAEMEKIQDSSEATLSTKIKGLKEELDEILEARFNAHMLQNSRSWKAEDDMTSPAPFTPSRLYRFKHKNSEFYTHVVTVAASDLWFIPSTAGKYWGCILATNKKDWEYRKMGDSANRPDGELKDIFFPDSIGVIESIAL